MAIIKGNPHNKKPSLKAGLIGGGLFILAMFTWLAYSLVREGFDTSTKPLPEFNKLFNDKSQVKLTDLTVFKSKIKPPETNYIIDGTYHLTVYKLYLKNDNPLSKILLVENRQSDRNQGPYSSYADDDWFEMQRASDEIDPINSLQFSYQGSIKQVAKNDTMACYYLKFKTFSLAYDKNPATDFWAQSKDADSIALDVSFIKKGKSLYVMLFFKKRKDIEDFEPNTLYDMLSK